VRAKKLPIWLMYRRQNGKVISVTEVNEKLRRSERVNMYVLCPERGLSTIELCLTCRGSKGVFIEPLALVKREPIVGEIRCKSKRYEPKEKLDKYQYQRYTSKAE